MFRGIGYYLPTSSTEDVVCVVVTCAGNAASSVGGAPAAAAPASWSGMTQLAGPFMGGDGGGYTSRNASVVIESISPFSSTVINDMQNAAKRYDTVANFVWDYWSDPQTAVGAGTGLWMGRGTRAYVSTNDSQTLVVVTASGCSLNSVGGLPGQPLPAFSANGFTQLLGAFNLTI